MENAPARQPRVSPAAPRVSRAWVTPACLAVAVVIAGVVILPPFAAGTLFPSRGTVSSSGILRAGEPAASGASSAIGAQTGDKPEGEVEAKYSDLPLAAEPAYEPPRRVASETSPGTTETRGTLATGVFASRPPPETAVAAEPPKELAVQPIPPLNTGAAASADAAPAISPPPARRDPLPLQTDLLPIETPGPPSATKPGPDRHG